MTELKFDDLMVLFAALKLLPSDSISDNLVMDKYERAFSYDEIRSLSGYFQNDDNDEALCQALTNLIYAGYLEIAYCYSYGNAEKELNFALTDPGILNGISEYGKRHNKWKEAKK